MKITHAGQSGGWRASFITLVRFPLARERGALLKLIPSREGCIIGGIIKLNDLSVSAEVSLRERAKTPTSRQVKFPILEDN